jgi:undecaprenyl-diphosphatase
MAKKKPTKPKTATPTPPDRPEDHHAPNLASHQAAEPPAAAPDPLSATAAADAETSTALTPDAPVAHDAATAPLRATLHQMLDTVDSPEKADAVIDSLLTAAEQEQAVATVAESAPPQDAATAAAHVAAVDAAIEGETPPETLLAESARAVIATQGKEREAISESVQAVFNPQQRGGAPTEQEPQRSFLRQAIIKRMSPYDALDAELFLWLNRLPHPPFLNRFFYFLTLIFRGGMAWYALMAAIVLWRPQRGWRIVRDVAAPLGLAVWLVEYPIKAYFRRKRPFITIVQAIVIGRKPGSWSFPSGHSATAYAGAWLLSRCLPRWRGPLYLIATLTAFSRIYLGAHYPGDVAAGSLLGVLFAWILRRVPWPWRSAER